MARGFQGEDRSTYDHPTWHYVNFPLHFGGERPLLGVSLSMDYPPAIDKSKWNVGQAVKHCQAALAEILIVDRSREIASAASDCGSYARRPGSR